MLGVARGQQLLGPLPVAEISEGLALLSRGFEMFEDFDQRRHDLSCRDFVFVNEVEPVALDAAGALCWRTETRLGEGALHHAVVGASRAALISAIDPRTDPDRILARGESVTYRLDLLDRAGGLLQRTYVLGPIQGQLDPRQAVITAGGLAVGMGPKTLLLPPGEEPTPDADENVGQ